LAVQESVDSIRRDPANRFHGEQIRGFAPLDEKALS